jgi:hypothetical protein
MKEAKALPFTGRQKFDRRLEILTRLFHEASARLGYFIDPTVH